MNRYIFLLVIAIVTVGCNGVQPSTPTVVTVTPTLVDPLTFNPISAEDYYNLGLAYYHQNDYKRAIADYDKAIQLKPDYVEAYYNRGLAYVGDPGRAIADYDKAIQLRPDYSDAYANRGLAYYNKGDYDRAIADYDEAIQLAPPGRGGVVYYVRGLAYERKGENDKAVADFKKAIELTSNPDLKQEAQAELDKLGVK